MEVEHSLEKIQPKLIDLLLTFVDRWPSQWLEWLVQACSCTAVLCNRRCQTLV